MKQLEIEFFWPLTQQIPLDLDFTDCEKPKLTTSITYPGISNGSSSTYITTGKLSIDAETTVIKVTEKPNILRRGLYKVLGVNWEKK